jgi:hypothetical protein
MARTEGSVLLFRDGGSGQSVKTTELAAVGIDEG